MGNRAPRISAVRILTENELRRCAELDLEALDVIEVAFRWLVEKEVDMPPIQHISVAGANSEDVGGDVDIKSAFVPGIEGVAVKIASGFFGNTAFGLPSGSGLMVVLDATTGFCRAVLLDNGYLTDLRTALAGGVAARHLAPGSVRVAGILGTGRQAELQARALHLVRPFEKLLIYGRNPAHAEKLMERLAGRLEGVEIEIAASAEEVVHESQCLVTTTASTEPLVRAEWLHPNLHITAMGSDLPGKQELAAEVLLAADLVVCDRISQCERLGELQHLPEERRTSLALVELGEAISGRHPARTSDEEITICDLTGTGVQDTAIAVHALRRAEEQEFGSTIEPN